MAASNGGRMPLIEHLRELRRRVFKSAVAITIGGVIGWIYYNPIVDKLSEPVCNLTSIKNQVAANVTTHCGALTITGVLGPLNLQIKVAILAGIMLTAPIWLYQLWAFIAPALHRKEKRNSIFFISAATPFFAVGAYLGYSVLPMAIKVLFGFTPASLNNLVNFDDYLSFVLRMILLFGIAFELPVFLVTFNFIGFLSGKTILKPWRIWVFGICLFVASFSPTADPLSMLLLALPLIGFYFLAGGIALLNDKRRAKRTESDSGETFVVAPAEAIESAKPIDKPEK
jgi:sec-independent protein translocase protein TatC